MSDRGCDRLLRGAQFRDLRSHEYSATAFVCGRDVVVEASRAYASPDDTLASCF